MPPVPSWPLWAVIAAFAVAALVVAVAGTRLAHVTDELADRTGLGEIVAGAVLVGASTSLPGAITSMTTARDGYAGLAIGNAVGGLTAQTAFLAVADMAYRRANLEHAAASAAGLVQAALLVALLTVPLLAMSGPDVTLGHVHPASLVLFVGYALGIRLLRDVKAAPLWTPVDTELTGDEAEQAAAKGRDGRTDRAVWLAFAGLASCIAVAGYAIGETSIALVEATALSETAVGGTFTAIANSLPELVTAIAAVRIGAVNLAVGDVIGGNAFEVLFLVAADLTYTEGSLYARFDGAQLFSLATVLLMVAVLLLGMLRRQRHGVGNIGWESATVLGLYVLSVAWQFAA